MKKYSLKQRFRYWIDKRMSNGTISMVKLLAFVVLGAVLLVTVLVMLFHMQKEGKGFLASFWDNLRSAMSSSFPSSDSGTIGYIILYTFLALVGMIFTGMLIGIFSSTMRGKVLALQKNNPQIMEKGHIVVLGFRFGEYALIEQLITAAWDDKRTIVIAAPYERTDMEDAVRVNLQIPKNVSLIFINADPTNPKTLACCSIPDARSVILQSKDKGRVIKALLAVFALLEGCEKCPEIVASVDGLASDFPQKILADRNVSLLYSNDVVARIISHAATQPDIFKTFMEVISFYGYEFYYGAIENTAGLRFGQIYMASANGIVCGLYRDGKSLLNPDPETEIREDDQFIIFEEEPGDIRLNEPEKRRIPGAVDPPPLPEIRELLIIGANRELPTIIRELPENTEKIRLTGLTPENKKRYLPDDSLFMPEITADYRDISDPAVIREMLESVQQLILLCDRKKSPEEADAEVMLQIMKLREMKREYGFSFSITAEMISENNRKLISRENDEDFVVATDLSSMILAQTSEDVRRVGLFTDLLNQEGHEVYLKSALTMGLANLNLSVGELRRRLYAMGYLLIGLRKGEESLNCSDVKETVNLLPSDRLILIGEE